MMNARQSTLLGLGCPDCGGGCQSQMMGLGADPDPINLNAETYRTRVPVSSYLKPGGEVLRNYAAGDVVGWFTESKLHNNQLWFRSGYGGWLPYVYNAYYFANLQPVPLSQEEKTRILLDIAKASSSGTGVSLDIAKTAAELAENVAEGAQDLAALLGGVVKNLKWVLITAGGAYVGYKVYQHYKGSKKSEKLAGLAGPQSTVHSQRSTVNRGQSTVNRRPSKRKPIKKVIHI